MKERYGVLEPIPSYSALEEKHKHKHKHKHDHEDEDELA
jgi:hypothetical protein